VSATTHYTAIAAAAVCLTAPAWLVPDARAQEQQESRQIPLAPDAPERYIVQRGDTLWDISAKFLRDPWYWPEIWYVNPQVENPHLIYPGDELQLVWVDGQPRVILARGGDVRLSPKVRSEPLSEAINTIPYEKIAAFMSRPTVLAKEDVDGAPYVARSKGDHLIAALGNTLYVRGLDDGAVDDSHLVYHVGDPLKDPDDGKVLGYQGIYTGKGRVTRLGDPASLLMTDSTRETLEGDRLFEESGALRLDFLPRAPRSKVEGRIMSVVDGVSVIGQFQVVVINRGKRDGLEPGNVLEIWQKGKKVSDDVKGGLGSKIRLPDERAGTFMVFQTHQRLSFGLVMDAVSDMRVGDVVKNP
jgi:LysM domain